MERFSLDLDHLPKNKKDALRFFMDSFATTTTDKSNLVCGLIFLGFRTLKGKNLSTMPLNIPTSSSDNFKIRINFTDAALSNYLSLFEAKKSKRNCVLALLYTGICSFEDYSLFIQKKNVKSLKKNISLDQIEEDIYLSGLTNFFEIYNSDYIVEFNTPQKKKKDDQIVGTVKTTSESTIQPLISSQPNDSSFLTGSNEAELLTSEQSKLVESSRTPPVEVEQSIQPTSPLPPSETRLEFVNSFSNQEPKRKRGLKVDVG